jgi:hypothetical protein
MTLRRANFSQMIIGAGKASGDFECRLNLSPDSSASSAPAIAGMATS